MFEPKKSKNEEKIGDILIVDHLEDIYNQTSNENHPRFEKFSKRYMELYSEKFTKLIRIPGVAELQQETPQNKDLCGFLFNQEKDVCIGFSERVHDDDIVICSLDKTKYPKVIQSKNDPLKYKFDENLENQLDFKHYNTVISAAKSFFNESNLSGKRVAMNILIDINIPNNEGFGISLGVIIGIYLAFFVIQGDKRKIKTEKIYEDVLKHYLILTSNDSSNVNQNDILRKMKVMFEGQGTALVKGNL